jgi:hypothetical protein
LTYICKLSKKELEKLTKLTSTWRQSCAAIFVAMTMARIQATISARTHFRCNQLCFPFSKSVKSQPQGCFSLRYEKIEKTQNIQNTFINRNTRNSIIETFSVTTFALFIVFTLCNKHRQNVTSLLSSFYKLRSFGNVT